MSEFPEALTGVAHADCTGMQALVTESTSEIGRATALALGRLGADVIIRGRNPQGGADVVDELSQSGVDETCHEANFVNIDAVRDLATTIRTETGGPDLLISNVGGLFPNKTLTNAGIEYTCHVNHLSPYLLTGYLLDRLYEDTRVVTTASEAHKGTALNLNQIRGDERYSGFKAYSHSKLANILFVTEFARRLNAAGSKITSNSVHSGPIPGSGFSRVLSDPLPLLFQRLEGVSGVTSVADGAAEILFVAVSPRTADVSGRYFTNQQLHTSSEAARNIEVARRLWLESTELFGIEGPLADDDRRPVPPGDQAAPADS